MGYNKDTLKGLSWAGSFRLVTRIITFLRIAILARLLSPAQFGVFGIASLVLSLIDIFTETGINIFLIQQKKDIGVYINTAWIISIFRGIIISFGIIISASFVSSFFHTPDAYNVLLLISLVPFFKGFINPAEVKFQKDLQFHKEFWFRSTLFFVESLIAIITAFYTHSVLSFALAMAGSAFLEVIFSFVFLSPRPAFGFNKSHFVTIFSNGRWVTIAGIFNYFFHNGDNIVVGRLLGTTSLGLYDSAYKISMLPITEIADIVSKVTFPVYVNISLDKKRLKRAFIRTMLGVTFLTLPLGFIIFFSPKLIITIILGDKWLPAANVLQVLALFGVIRTITGSPSTLFYALGKQNYVSYFTFTSFITLAFTIVPLVHLYGLIGAAYSVFIATIAPIPLVVYYLIRIFK